MLRLASRGPGKAAFGTRVVSRSLSVVLPVVPSAKRRGSGIAWALLVGGAGVALADVSYPNYVEEDNRARASKVIFMGGQLLAKENDEEATLPRDGPKKSLLTLLSAKTSRGGSSVVYAPKGSGKTSVMKQAAAEAGDGVVYVDAAKGLAKAVDEALGCKPGYESLLRAVRARILRWAKADLPAGPPADAEYVRAWDNLELAAEKAWEKNKKPTVVVIDNVDLLAEKEPEALNYVQFAVAADASRYRLALVVSDAAVLRDIQAGPSWTRASRIVEIPDLTREEALVYLEAKRGIPHPEAKLLVGLFGGRVGDLALAADRYQEGATIEEIEADTWGSVIADFEHLEGLSTTPKGDQISLPLMTSMLRSPDHTVPLADLQTAMAAAKMDLSAEALVKQSRVLALDASGRYVRFAAPLDLIFAKAKYGAVAAGKMRVVPAAAPLPPTPEPDTLPSPPNRPLLALPNPLKLTPHHLLTALKVTATCGATAVVGLWGIGALNRPGLTDQLLSARNVGSVSRVLYDVLAEGAHVVAGVTTEAVRVVVSKVEGVIGKKGKGRSGDGAAAGGGSAAV